jgi:uncharacterized RDD family membrane protein YckC
MLGLIFLDYFISLGSWGIVIGFSIVLAYFTLIESGLGSGQSVGKTFLNLKVVSCNGDHLSLTKSLIRSSVFFAPLFL